MAEENYLKGVSNGADVSVPQELLDGNYISYRKGPAAPTDEGVEGLVKTAPDGLYYYSSGLWRKVPAYTVQEQWGDLTASVRFLQLDRDIALTPAERERVRGIVGITVAAPSAPGLVKPSASTQSSGGVNVDSDGGMFVPYATETAAGVLRITEDSTGQPVAASKGYVDALIGDGGSLAIAPATATKIGGIRVGGDIAGVTMDGYAAVARSAQLQADTTYTATLYGLTRLAPSSLVSDPSDTTYDDGNVGAGRQPYVATVSIARSIASHEAGLAVSGITYPTATGTTLGLARGGAGITVANGAFSVNEAVAGGQRGTVLVAGSIPSDTGSDSKVPTVGAVKGHLASAGYLTDAALQTGAYTASSSRYGVLKVNANSSETEGATGLVMSRDGTLSMVFPYASAGSGKSGLVKVDATMSGTAGVPQTSVVKGYVDAAVGAIHVPGYATSTAAGTVKVLTGAEDAVAGPPYHVPTSNYIQSEFLETPKFESAVRALVSTTGAVWDGGTVANAAVFNNTATFNGSSTFNGSVSLGDYAAKQQYSAGDVLSYTQIVALVQGGASVPWASFASDTVLVSASNMVCGAGGSTFAAQHIHAGMRTTPLPFTDDALTVHGDTYADGVLTVADKLLFGQQATAPVSGTGLTSYNNNLYWNGTRVVTGSVSVDPKEQPYKAWVLYGVEGQETASFGSMRHVLDAMHSAFNIASYVNNGVLGTGMPDEFVTIKSGITVHFEYAVSYADMENATHDIMGALRANKCALVPAFIPDNWT